jgi:TonB family protein
MTWLAFAIEILWKGSIVLAAAFAASWLWQRRSASLRHFLWTAAFGALLLLPAVMRVVPKWSPAPPPVAASVRISALRTSDVQVVRGVHAPASKTTPAPDWPLILWTSILWTLGCAAAAARFLVGALRTSWMVRHASPADYARATAEDLVRILGIGRRVRVLESVSVPVPLTWGILRPVVVLPDDAPEWPEARLATVLRHELIHVRRFDLLAQAVGQAACCLYWFQPLAWLALRQLRKERERACDDAVLLAGVAPHDYAGHLMDLVRGVSIRKDRWADAPAMAEASDLESRIRALLDRRQNRRPLSRRAAFAIAGVVAAMLLPFAAITMRAQGARGSLAGVVEDPSGSRVPGCRVTAKNLDGSNQETTVANAAGEYQFASIPVGHYALEFGARGFALAKMDVVLAAGTAARVDGRLELGTINENVVIRGQKPPSVAPRATTAQRIPVGGSVTPARLVTQTKPVYPADLQQLGVEGTVVMAAVISKDGTVLNPRVRNTVDSRLAQIALDAVRQWRYEPALLNGHPVETVTTITLEFQLGQ